MVGASRCVVPAAVSGHLEDRSRADGTVVPTALAGIILELVASSAVVPVVHARAHI